MKNRKSPGVDGTNSVLVKQILPSIIEVVTFFINLSFSSRIFLDKVKTTVVVPIHYGSYAEFTN